MLNHRLWGREWAMLTLLPGTLEKGPLDRGRVGSYDG